MEHETKYDKQGNILPPNRKMTRPKSSTSNATAEGVATKQALVRAENDEEKEDWVPENPVQNPKQDWLDARRHGIS